MTDNPVYADVMVLLSDNGFGVVGDVIFGGEWGTTTGNIDIDEQILVLDGVGVPSDLKDLFEQPSVQILVRGATRGMPDSAEIEVYSRAKQISNFLLSQPETIDINGNCYTGFEEGSNIAPLGKDENERFTYSMNFTTYRNR